MRDLFANGKLQVCEWVRTKAQSSAAILNPHVPT